jgi:hypothetical protein
MSNKLYAIGNGDRPLSYSEDKGLTWQWLDVTIPDRPAEVHVRPFYPDEVFVPIVPAGAGTPALLKSIDAGLTFTPVTLPASVTGILRLQFVSADVAFGIAYQNLAPTFSDFFLISSSDGGNTFTQGIFLSTLLPSGFDLPTIAFVLNYRSDILFNFTDPAEGFIGLNITEIVDPTNQKILIAKTTTAGATFDTSFEWNGYYLLDFTTNNEVERLLLYVNEISPANSGLVFTLDDNLLGSPTFIENWGTGGLYDFSGGNNVFYQVEYEPSKVFALDKSPANSAGLLYSDDFGLTWTVQNLTLPQEFDFIVAYDQDTVVVQASGSTYNIHRSTDGGVTFTDVFDAPNDTGSSKAMDTTETFGCGECPPGYVLNEFTDQCELNSLGGQLCNPPYFLYGPNGQCALPSTIQPSNILYAIDNSSSVSDDAANNERQLFADFINLLTDKLSDRLSINSIKVGVVHWATEACYDQTFTSDKALITESVNRILSCPTCPDFPCKSTTNHVAALCESLNALNAQSLANPSAENVLIVFTDGTNNVEDSCDLSSIGLSPSVTIVPGQPFPNAFFELAADAKANLAGKGLKIMMCVVGTQSERSGVKSTFLDTPIAAGIDPYPSIDEDGNYYYFDAGNFSDASFIAQQLILGLGADFAPSLDCPPDCEKVPGPDNQGYCQCLNIAPLEQCQYRLIDCLDVQTPIITDADLQTYFDAGNIITIVNSDTCWEIEKLDQTLPNPQSIIVDEVFGECLECLPSSKLFNCADINNVIYSSTDLSMYQGQTIQLQEYPGECWQVGPNNDEVYTPEPLTINGRPYANCEECNPTKYQLTNCLNGGSFIISDSDLSAYTGKAIRAINIPGLCFYITSPPACLCVRISVNDVIYQVNSAPNLFGGKNSYPFQTLALDNLTLAWNDQELYWEVFNSDTLETYAYNTLDTACPFSSNWTIVDGSTFVVNYVTYCYDELYNIEVEQDFVSCEACINC